MSTSINKAFSLLMGWYVVPKTGFCRLVPLDADLTANPTEEQQDVIVYPEQEGQDAGTFFACNEGRLFSAN